MRDNRNYILAIGTLKDFSVKSEKAIEFLESIKDKRVNIFLKTSELTNGIDLFIDSGSEEITYRDKPFMCCMLDKVIHNFPSIGISTYTDSNNDSFTIEMPVEFINKLNKTLKELSDNEKFVFAYLWAKYGLDMFDKLHEDTKLTNEEKQNLANLCSSN